tara:strand:+ start:1226 stop:1789 length:564 start_codon:yes stop_codon:yes gene_type:complete
MPGNGSTNVSLVPVLVSTPAGADIKKILATKDGGLLLTRDGEIWGWGYNTYGRLGNGTTTLATAPIRVGSGGSLSGKKVDDIAVTADSMCALADGQVHCWGRNHEGQIGNGTTTNSSVPVLVTTSGALNGKEVISLNGGGSSVNGQVMCALTSERRIVCWGSQRAYSSAVYFPGGTVPVEVNVGEFK